MTAMLAEDARLPAQNCGCHSSPNHQNWPDKWFQIQNKCNIIIFFSSGFVEHQHLPQHDNSFQILLQRRTNGDGCQHQVASVLISMSTGNDQQSIIAFLLWFAKMNWPPAKKCFCKKKTHAVHLQGHDTQGKHIVLNKTSLFAVAAATCWPQG